MPEPPYYAVIFVSQRRDSGAGNSDAGYEAMANRMVELARQMPGFLGIDSVRDASGAGITVSYWRDEESIAGWRRHGEHRVAQERGQREWYESYQLHVARVERAYTDPASSSKA